MTDQGKQPSEIDKFIANDLLKTIGKVLILPFWLMWLPFKGMAKPFQQPRCPQCGSKNNSLDAQDHAVRRGSRKLVAAVIFLPLVFFVGNKKVRYGECFDCNYKWRIR